MSLFDIPKDIYECHMFPHIDERDLIVLGMTNEFFSKLINKEKFWKQKCKSVFNIKSRIRDRPAKRRKKNVKDEPTKKLLWRTTFARNAKNRCVHHITERGEKKEPFEDIALCKNCRISDIRYRMITKTNAVKEYKLNEYVLFDSDVYRVECQNPYYRNASSMYLFLESEVEQLAIKVHGSREGLAAAIQKSKDISEKRRATKKRKLEEKEADRQKRRKILVEELDKENLHLHSDTVLCNDYIEGDDKRSVSEIVQTIKTKLRQIKERDSLRRKRTDILVEALKEENLTLRSDSVLCKNYINGSDTLSLDEIVQTMKKMKILYEELGLRAKWEYVYQQNRGEYYDKDDIRDHHERFKERLWNEYLKRNTPAQDKKRKRSSEENL